MASKKSETQSNTSLGIRPLTGYLLVEPFEAETRTSSGIYLPETAQEKKADQGTVVAVGGDIYLPDGKAFVSPVNVGNKIVYKKWGGDDVKFKNKEYKIVKFEDVLALIEE